MDEMIYEGVTSYYNRLEYTGYMSYSNMEKLLILIFYRDFVFNDYRGILSKEDYHLIEKTLDCLYGTTCLIPYPDYLKMGRLYLGETTELSHRIRAIEDSKVLKLMHDLSGTEDPDSDVHIVEAFSEEEPLTIDELVQRNIQKLQEHEEKFETVNESLAGQDARIEAVEQSKVVKGKNYIRNIPSIDLTDYDDIPEE